MPEPIATETETTDDISELEALETELSNIDQDLEFDAEGTTDAPEPEPEDTGETGQVAEPSRPEPAAEKEVKPKTVMLPDDKDAFGKLAGQKVTYEQLAENGLVDKLVTWGHQGRHMVQRGQEDLDEARKLREAIEKQVALTEKMHEEKNAPPPVSVQDHTNALVEQYTPLLRKNAEQGGMEATFLENYPRVAALIEDRFQAGSQLLTGIINAVSGLQKGHETWTERDATNEGRSQLRKMTSRVAEDDEVFKFLATEEGHDEFLRWVTSEDSGFNWVDKDLKDVTQREIEASALVYMRAHPEKFTKSKAKATPEQRQRASGAAGAPRVAPKKTADEILDLMSDLVNAGADAEY